MSFRLAICTSVAHARFQKLLEPLSQVAVQWVSAAELPEAANRADALVLSAADYFPAVAHALSGPESACRWLQLLTAGYETLQMHGVPDRLEVTNAGSVWSPMVAEHAMAMILAVARRVPALLAAQARGQWDDSIRQDMAMLFGARLVIVGMGSIGGELARRARAFGMHVTGVSRSGRAHPDADQVLPVSCLHEALSQADFVVCAVPGSPTNTGLIGASELAACSRQTVIVNLGRGNVIDTPALLHALQTGIISGAALDVTDPEPLPEGHPLWQMPNVIISPHLGGAAPERYYDRLAHHVVHNLQARLAGQPLKDRIEFRASA
ncbi:MULTISPECIES: D-2-hydroxyacid dehydrogenase [unclassified Variovorax]|jgi:phosphoglycerate dehydrogenase-like enzyme|uniref:D-2-hydroxyacid dehydrogenase n=1 Tax=unclassified Variovorax TaxID=663243 RepID=UPI000AADFAFE|nr:MULTISPECIES: D-2-hydroxyacid dehydrogenase [unclassified Variovorax]